METITVPKDSVDQRVVSDWVAHMDKLAQARRDAREQYVPHPLIDRVPEVLAEVAAQSRDGFKFYRSMVEDLSDKYMFMPENRLRA